MKKLLEGFCHYFTDAKGRGEIKVVLGLAFIGIAIARLFMDKGIAEFSVIAGMGLTMILGAAWADKKLDDTADQLIALKYQVENGLLEKDDEDVDKPEQVVGFSTDSPPEPTVV